MNQIVEEAHITLNKKTVVNKYILFVEKESVFLMKAKVNLNFPSQW